MAYEHLGTDIAFGETFRVTYGDVDTADGRQCLAQDIRLRLLTPRGDLWCHPTYGIDIYRFLHLEGTYINQLDLVQAIEDEVSRDPRVDSVSAEILSWDGYTVAIKVTLVPVSDGSPINYVLGYDLSTMTLEVVSGGS